jgi:hypothetical protein
MDVALDYENVRRRSFCKDIAAADTPSQNSESPEKEKTLQIRRKENH